MTKGKNRPTEKHPCRRRKGHLRKGREEKYLSQFATTLNNKRRRLSRQVRKHPNDKVAVARLKALG